MATRGKAPLKIGSGYLDILPQLNRAALGKVRAELASALTSSGVRASRAVTAATGRAFTGIATKAGQSAKAAGKAVEAEAAGTTGRLKGLTRSLTVVQNEEARKRIHSIRAVATEREAVESNAARAAQTRIQSQIAGERHLAAEVKKLKGEQVAASNRAAASEKAAQAEITQSVRQRMAAEKQAYASRMAHLRSELAGLQQQRAEFMYTIRSNRAQMREFDTDHTGKLKRAANMWVGLGKSVQTFTNNLSLVGSAINRNLILPLGAAAAAMTVAGAKAADAEFYAHQGLVRGGFDKKKVAEGLDSIQQFAIKTPFSLKEMQEQYSKSARNFQGITKNTDEALMKAEKLIRSVSDTTAAFGDLDPEKLKRAMSSVDYMMDMSKIDWPHMRQFINATGMQAGQLAKIGGYKDADAFTKAIGKRQVDSAAFFDRFMKWYDTAPGVKGTAEAKGTETVTGKFGALKEQAESSLGKMLGYTDKATGDYVRTNIGEKLWKIGDRLEKLLADPAFKKFAEGLMSKFADVVNKVIDYLEKIIKGVEGHPKIKEWIVKTAKVAFVLGPLASAIGLATRAFQVAAGLFKPVRGVLSGFYKSVRGAGRTLVQVVSGIRGALKGAGQGFKAFREAYKARREKFHDGDERSALRRGWDKIRGKDSRAEKISIKTKDAEKALKKLDEKILEVKKSIIELNKEKLNKLADEFGGESGTTVKAQAKDADKQVDELKQSIKSLNDTQKLNQIANEFGGESGTSIKAQAKDANQQIDLIKKDLKELNSSYKLNTVANEFGGESGSSIKAQAKDARKEVDTLKKAIPELNNLKLNQLAGEFGGEAGTSIKAQAKDARTQVGQIKTVVSELNALKLNQIAGEFGGEAGTSIKAQAKDAYNQINTIKTVVAELNALKLNQIAGEFGGEAGSSIKAQAKDAADQVLLLKTEVQSLNGVKLNQIAGELGGEAGTSIKAQAKDATKAVEVLKTALNQLNQVRLNQVAGELGGEKGSSVKAQAKDAQKAVDSLKKALTTLNNTKLSSVKREFDPSLTGGVKGAYDKAEDLRSKLSAIDRMNTNHVKHEFEDLREKLDDVGDKACRLLRIISKVNKLTGHVAHAEAVPPKCLFASGGVLPGYRPGVDTIPAMLSPGEAVLRPEVARMLGAPLINFWNQQARRGRVRRFADGIADASGNRSRIGSKNWISELLNAMNEIRNLAPGVRLFTSGITLAGSTVRLGETGQGVRRWGLRSAGEQSGEYIRDRLLKYKEFIIKQLPEILKHSKTGLGTLLGWAASAIWPVVGQHFWDDVWKGKGNELQRGGRFVSGVFKDLPKILKNAWKGAKEIIKGFWETIKEFASDPGEFLSKKADEIKQSIHDMFTGLFDTAKEMMKLISKIIDDPSKFAKEALGHFMKRVKELLPNTEGLWLKSAALHVKDEFLGDNFADGGVVPGYGPGRDSVPARLSPGEGVLRPEVVRHIGGRRVIRSLNEAGKSGKLSSVSNKASGAGSAAPVEKVSTPVPDSKLFEESAAKIREALDALEKKHAESASKIKASLGGTEQAQQESASEIKSSLDGVRETYDAAADSARSSLDGLVQSIQAHSAASKAAWDHTANDVRSAVDEKIKPAQTRWNEHLKGPVTQAQKSFKDTAQASWTAIAAQVSRSSKDSSQSMEGLKRNLTVMKQFFEASGAAIRKTWEQSMKAVDSSTRSTVSGPYNRGAVPMMANMAKLAGTAAPLRSVGFSRGGVVPGYQPGVDTVPALLSKGEGILRPEVVRDLGEETVRRWNERARRTGHMYARGGVVGHPISWSGQSGGDWVNQNKDKDFENYLKAFQAGFKAVIQPMLNRLEQSFGVLGVIQKLSFQKVQPWLEKWVKWVDERVFSGGGEVVKRAFQEYKAHGGSHIGTKYSGGVVEAWCADFISWCVDKAGANAAYGNSPRGTPGNRWAAVVTWVESMKNHVPTSQSRPGDLMVYGGRHSSGWDHINLKVSKTSTIGGNEGNSVRHSSSYWQRATKALRPSGGVSRPGQEIFNPWPGSVPKYDGPLGGGVDHGVSSNWTGAIAEAMRLTGVSGDEWMRGMAVIIQRESSGNPRDINLYDSNARRGDPSRGLAQVIGETFREHHQPGTSWDIYDPVANLSASINYIRRRYGHISRVQQANPNLPAKGYWRGVRSASPGMALVGEKGPELVKFRGGERVFDNRTTADILAKRYEIHIHQTKSEDTTQAVIRGLRYAETMYGSF